MAPTDCKPVYPSITFHRGKRFGVFNEVMAKFTAELIPPCLYSKIRQDQTNRILYSHSLVVLDIQNVQFLNVPGCSSPLTSRGIPGCSELSYLRQSKVPGRKAM